MSAHPLAHVFWGCLLDHANRALPGTAVLLSGGVDSQAVLCALLKAEKRPQALSFYAGDYWSADVTRAAETCEALNVRFTPIHLDSDPDRLREYVRWAVSFGLYGKAAIECFWPRKVAIDYAADAGWPGIATGDGGDGYFGLSKRAMIHVRPGGADAMDEFREWYFARPDWSQTASIRGYCRLRGLREPIMPLADPRLLYACRGWDWESLNSPRQKQPIRDTFERLETLPPHVNLQLGDSGIAEAFERLTAGDRTARSLYHGAEREAERRASGQEALDL
jgi:hypothetical protein